MSVVRLGRVALARSMPEFVEDLLAETPRVPDPERQGPLTERLLVPALPALTALFLHVRADIDPGQRRAAPTGAKPYPLGRCLEITEAVRARLAELDAAALPPHPAQGLAALRAFVAAGGSVRRAWGELRGRYFQNALVVGTLYVDVANDTVVIEKPPVEILPLADAGFRPISDYAHFGRIAEGYWGLKTLPNHLAPDLAPWFPLIEIDARGAVRLGSSSRSLLGANLAGGFSPGEQFLAGGRLPPGLFRGLRAALAGAPGQLAANPDAGRAAALAACAAQREQRMFDCPAAFNRAVAGARDLNGRLARVRAGLAAAPPATSPPLSPARALP